MKEGLISIIVPMFNVEKHIRKCIASVLSQTYQNFELILIDEGSSDNTYDICKEYASEKIILYKMNHNKGVSIARNKGIELSSGEYISFIDADDWVKEEYLELLFKLIKKQDADMSCCGYEKDIKEPYKKEEQISNATFYTGREVFLNTSYGKIDDCGSLWGKLYKAKLFEKNRFAASRHYEDTALLYKVRFESKRVCYCNNKLYSYTTNVGSITHNFTKQDAEDAKLAGIECVDFFESTGDKECYNAAKIRYLGIMQLIIRQMYLSKTPRKEYAAVIDEYRKY